MSQFESQFEYSDLTLNEADGEFSAVREIMARDGVTGPWFLRSGVTLVHPGGVAQMTLEFWHTGLVKIVSFHPSCADPLVNLDVRCLRAWTDANGWSTPEPSRNVLNEMLPFWKYFWDTHLVNCPDLDKRYGERRLIETGGREDEEGEDSPDGGEDDRDDLPGL